MAGSTGLEPATSPVTGERSSQLSYDPTEHSMTVSPPSAKNRSFHDLRTDTVTRERKPIKCYTASPVSPLSLTSKRWIFAPKRAEGVSLVNHLAALRGIDLGTDVSWETLGDPFALGDMKEAVERTHHAIQSKEKVGIIGDYDADGITGVAQLVRFFRRHGIEPKVILPHREKHGYGVKKVFIEEFHAEKITLLFTVDTGISSVKEIAYARERGMDVIVLDHHSLSAELPQAFLVHPLLQTTHYTPLTPLSGSGVVFSFLRAFEGNSWEGNDVDSALAAIGTVADVVSLTGENRIIVALGLAAMNRGGIAPIFELARAVKKEGEILQSSHIGFRIAPRINAAGRLEDPLLALKAILQGEESLTALHALNEERQDLLQEMLQHAEEMVDPLSPFITLASPSFHLGIIGLIAGRHKERFGRPSVACCLRGNTMTCSLRSIPGYNVVETLKRCSSFLSSFGGHELAAGCTLGREQWEEFSLALREDAASHLDPSLLVPTIMIDAVLEPHDLTHTLLHELSALEPHGAGNREPLFLLKKQSLRGVRCVGKEGKHLQCFVGQTKAVGFGLGHLLPSLPSESDIVCRLGVNAWSGREEVQVFIEDIAVSSSLPLVQHTN